MLKEDFEDLCSTCLIILDACIEKWDISYSEMSKIVEKYKLCTYIKNYEDSFQSRGIQGCVGLIEDYIQSKLNLDDIKKIQKRYKDKLLVFLSNNVTNKDIDRAVSILYSTRIYKCLMNEESDFYRKSYSELCYLLEKELSGNKVACENSKCKRGVLK